MANPPLAECGFRGSLAPMTPAKKRIFMARLVCVPLSVGLVLLELTPLPVAALFLLYLAIWRPRWFLTWVYDLYGLD